MDTLAFLSSREIVDRTGLTYRYDFTLTYSDRVSADASTDGPPPLLTAVQEQLGLKLDPEKTSLEYIVIDQIERPAAN